MSDIAISPDEFPNLVHLNLPPSHTTQLILPPIHSQSNIVPLRHSTGVHKPSTYLKYYHCNLVIAHVSALASLNPLDNSIASSPSSILYPFSSTLSYNKLSTTHKAFSIALTINNELESYAQALKRS